MDCLTQIWSKKMFRECFSFGSLVDEKTHTPKQGWKVGHVGPGQVREKGHG